MELDGGRSTEIGLAAAVARSLLRAPVGGAGLAIEAALQRVAQELGADVAVLARRVDDDTFERSYTWRRDGATDPELAPRTSVNRGSLPFLFELLASARTQFIRDADFIARDAVAERGAMARVGVQSVLIVPVGEAGAVRGYLSCSWRAGGAPEEVPLGDVVAVADVLAIADERSVAEATLAETTAQLDAVVDALAEAILITYRDGRVVAANQAAAEVFGMDADALVEHRQSMLEVPVRPDGSPFTVDDLPTYLTLADGRPRLNVLEGITTHSGERRWVSVNTRPLRRAVDDEPYAVVTSFADVTEVRRLEEQLVQATKMEALGRLAGGVAHDFNNILTAITGYTTLVMAELAEGDPRRDDLAQVDAAAQRAVTLVDQLLSFSRRKVLAVEAVDIHEVVATMWPMLERVIPAHIRIETRYGDEPAVARCSRDQLEQVVLNLVVNAGDAMPDGGTLLLETAHRGNEFEGPYVVLSVSDTGVGMTADVQARIFEPFFTTKPIGEGTGLGLATAYGAVTQAGGRITVYSEPGQGSTFRVYLPDAGTDASAPVVASDAADEHGDEVVLVVEDDEAVRRLTVQSLRRRGYTVLEADDAITALAVEESERGRIDLLLTDVVLPSMRGPALAAAVRAHNPGIAVLFMSGYAEGVLAPEFEGEAFLAKPFRPFELAAAVRAAVGAAR
ncbi:MAG: ATP-binding protein [Acidimicrobiia bacterium]